MNKKLILLLSLYLSSLALFAQNNNLTIELVSKQTLKKSALAKPENYYEIWDYNDSIVGYQSPFHASITAPDKKMTVIYNNKQFEVEMLPETEIAPEAGILIKYGSRNLLSPRDNDFKIIYYDLNGNKLLEIPKKYEGAACSLSKNGFLAITGRLIGYKDIEGSHVSLYDKNGKEIFTKALGSDNWVRDIQISPNGNYIALVYTTLRYQSANNRFNLMILKADGTIIFDKRYSISFDNLIFSPDENYLLGITYNYLCLINTKNSSLIWENNNDYNTGRSPVVFFENYNCILIQTSLKGIWTLNLLDIETGNEIYKTELPDKQPPTNYKSLFQKNNDEFMIKSPISTYNFKIKPKN